MDSALRRILWWRDGLSMVAFDWINENWKNLCCRFIVCYKIEETDGYSRNNNQLVGPSQEAESAPNIVLMDEWTETWTDEECFATISLKWNFFMAE